MFTILVNSVHAYNLDSLRFEHLLKVDTPPPTWTPKEQPGSNPTSANKGKGLILNNPENIKTEYSYNPETGKYEVKQTVGGKFNYRNPTEMSLEDYLEYERQKSKNDFFKEKIAENNSTEKKKEEEESGVPEALKLGFPVKGKAFDRIFGGNAISIKPQGSAEITLGLAYSKVDNPAIPVKQRKLTTFDFDQKIQVNIVGNIGSKLKISTSYNTEATFDFENQVKIEYTGEEDEIIKKLEAGNVSMPLSSSLITGSQGLFGVKGQFQFGRLTATAIFSQQKAEKKSIEVAGGAQITNYEIDADNYEANKHYFLSTYFRNRYDQDVQRLPEVPPGAIINRIEVWVTNTTQNFEETRNIIAFTDLGENPKTSTNPNGYTYRTYNSTGVNDSLSDNAQNQMYAALSNDANVRSFDNATMTLLQNQTYLNPSVPLEQAVDYEKIESARKLSPSEYSFNARMGFISLNQALNNDEVLAVSYEYTDVSGAVHQVGEFSTDGVDGTNALILKLLKGTLVNTHLPLWDLMMKNVYNIGAYQVSPKDFVLDVFFRNPETGVDINYIPENEVQTLPLLQLLKFDRLNSNTSNSPDGFYDFIDGAATNVGTINSRNGRVFFPSVEPFGTHLRKLLIDKGVNSQVADRIIFQQLYDSTRAKAQQYPEFDRYSIKGKYESSSGSDISLNSINVPEGSVTVTAGGVKLTEGVDYTVDYTLGRVKIINAGLLESNTPINVDFESNSLFNIQTKTLMGANFDFEVNKDFHIGATFMRLSERPLTRKVNAGLEPIANNVVGTNVNFSKDVPWLTRITDMIPGISTKETSSVSATGEFAYLIPGQPKIIGDGGVSYIDDFEGSQSAIDIKNVYSWKMASTPQGQNDLFPEGNLFNDLAYGYNRASLSWYTIDPVFFRNNNLTPDNIKGNADIQNNHYQREIFTGEIFPNKQIQSGTPTNIPTLDLAFNPSERGMYNYDTDGLPGVSNGIDPATGLLNNPETRWGGITRSIQTTDFELANVEYLQFWMMDPFTEDAENGNHDGEGSFYINLGNISEDILRDDKKVFENGLPTTEAEALDITDVGSESVWGRIPKTQQLTNAFDANSESRKYQDVGLDGLIDGAEEKFHKFYKDWVEANVTNPAKKQELLADISGDNYKHYLNGDYDNISADIIERYRKFNGLDGNSPEQDGGSVSNSATTVPDVEDINGDFVSNSSEQYYQYKIDIDKNKMNIGENYIVDIVKGSPSNNSAVSDVNWYQFKIPVRSPDKTVGSISDFRSIRFMRMLMHGFDKSTVLRFARMEFIRGEWRRYDRTLEEPGEGIIQDPEEPYFAISAVSLEENGGRSPIPYVVPPGIQREIQAGPQAIELNEQSLELSVCNLPDGDSRATFKNVGFDVRSYKKMRMFAHLEEVVENTLEDGDVTLYVRLGSDYNENYYEYELPLKKTAHGTSDENAIWPEENEIEIEFKQLTNLKAKRNLSGQQSFKKFSETIEGNKVISVKGNPNLTDMKTIMIGVRNPKATGDNPFKPDDGEDKCAIVWVNELRLTDFDNQGGWATVGQVNTNLGDFATISMAGHMSTPGWGSIEKRVSERQRETIKGFDVQTTVQAGKFFGDKAGVRLPVYFGYSQEVITPQFDPSSGDILTADAFASMNSEQKKNHADLIETKRTQKNLNFSNIGLNPSSKGKKTRFYSPSNISLNLAFNETFYKDYFVKYDINSSQRYGLSYNFNNSPKNYKPFSNKSKLKSKWFKIIKDINFYLAPKTLSFNTNLNRNIIQKELRPAVEGALIVPQVNKQFTWNRDYKLIFDLAKNVKFNFSAQNASLIIEPDGIVDRQETIDSVTRYLKDFGLNTRYQHQYEFKVKLPLDKIPALKFLRSNFSYSAGYQWQRMNLIRYTEADDTLRNYNLGAFIQPRDYTGNTIENNRTINMSVDMNFMTIYNKVKLFKKVNSKFRRQGRSRPKPNSSNTKGNGQDKDQKDKSKDQKKKGDITITDYLVKTLMMFKNASAKYNVTNGTFMPGYTEGTSILGFNENWKGPGVGFILGKQNYNILGQRTAKENEGIAYDLANNGFIVGKEPGTFVNQQYRETHATTLGLKATLEPLPDLRIDLNADQTYTENNQAFFRYEDMEYGFFSQSITGSYSSSFIAIGSSFLSDDKETFENGAFTRFLENRVKISEDLGTNVGEKSNISDTTDYREFYGATNQDVLISSFISAYGNKKAKYYDPVKVIPLPNWRVNYTGLSKIPFIKKAFRTFKVSHGYQSTYSVSSFTNVLADSLPSSTDLNGNYWAVGGKQINTVSVTERFSPLIGVDMETNNKILLKAEYKKDRTLTMSLANNQITEVKGEEYTFGLGFRVPKVPFPFKTKKPIKSDLNVRGDVSIRNNATVARKIVEETNQATAGQRVISIKGSVDYTINKMIQVRLFYDQVINKPVVSNAFPTTNISGGLSIRLTLN